VKRIIILLYSYLIGPKGALVKEKKRRKWEIFLKNATILTLRLSLVINSNVGKIARKTFRLYLVENRFLFENRKMSKKQVFSWISAFFSLKVPYPKHRNQKNLEKYTKTIKIFQKNATILKIMPKFSPLNSYFPQELRVKIN